DRKSTRLNSSHTVISYAVFCLKKKEAFARNREVCRATDRRPMKKIRRCALWRQAAAFIGSYCIGHNKKSSLKRSGGNPPFRFQPAEKCIASVNGVDD